MRRKRRKSSNPFKIIFILLIMLLLLDFGIHFVLPTKNTAFNINRPKEYQELFVPGQFGRLQPDLNETVLFNGVTFKVKTNNLGMRSSNTSIEKPDQTTRIAIVGDSTSFGWLMEKENSFPYILHDKLNQESSTLYEVLNFSAPGYSTLQASHLFKTFVKDFQPNVLILSSGLYDSKPEQINDQDYYALLTEHGFTSTSSWKALLNQFSTIGNWWINRSKLSFNEKLSQLSSENIDTVRVSQSDAKTNMQFIINEMQTLGGNTILLDTNIQNHYLLNIIDELKQNLGTPVLSIHDVVSNTGNPSIKKIRYQKDLAYPGKVESNSNQVSIHFRCYAPQASKLVVCIQNNQETEWFDMNNDGLNGDETANDDVWSIDIEKSNENHLLYAFFDKEKPVDLFRNEFAWLLKKETLFLGFKTVVPLRQYGLLPHQEFRIPQNPEYLSADLHPSIANRLYYLITSKS